MFGQEIMKQIFVPFLGYALALALIIYCWAVVLSLFRQLKNSLVPMGPPDSSQQEEKRSNDGSTSVSMTMSANKENDLSGHVTPMLAEEGRVGGQSQTASSLASSEHNNGYHNNGFLE